MLLLASEDVVRLTVGVTGTRAETATSARGDSLRLRRLLLLLLLLGSILILLALNTAVVVAVAVFPAANSLVVLGVVVVDVTAAVAALCLICLPGQLGLPHQFLHRIAAAPLAIEPALTHAGAVAEHVALVLREIWIVGVTVARHDGVSTNDVRSSEAGVCLCVM